MKKQVLLGTVLLAAISTFSQNRPQPKSVGLLNMKLVAESKYSDNGTIPLSSSTKATPSKSTSKTSVVTTWQNFTASMNIYGVVISYAKPLQWNDELNAVTFVHRKSPTYPNTGATANSESGSIVTMISLDCGETWDSTLVYADATHRGRYPQGAIYNPPGNTNINNAYIVNNGPITHGSGWVGNFYASKPLGTANYNATISAVPNAVQYFSSAGPYPPNLGRHDFSAYNFTATDDGKMRSLAGITDDGLTADTAVMLVTGTFNTGTNTFDWSGRVFDPPTTDNSDGTENWVSRPMMAWNEAGTIGYVVIMGSRLGATGSNVGFQPIVYKTTDAGATWSLENGINFNSPAYKDVTDRLWAVDIDTTLKVPNFFWAEGIDCTVDADNKLHIFSSLLAHPSNHPDSLNFVSQFNSTERYRWPHIPGFHPYIYDFIYDGTNPSPGWSHLLIDSMSTEGLSAASAGAGYGDNPWDMDPANSNQKVRIDSRLQISRTPDAKYLLYSWAESDTAFTDNQKKWNNIPNIKVRLYDVTTGKLHPHKIDATVDASGDVANRAMYHYISTKFKFNTKVGEDVSVTVPMTVSNSNPYAQTSTNLHWYSCAALTFTMNTVGIENHGSANALNSSIFPNPAKNNATVKVNLTSSSKIQIDVMNTIGQVVRTLNVQGQTGSNSVNVDLSGLSGGIYLVSIKSENAASTKKLIIE